MNEQIRKVCVLLESDRPEHQCAAAMVLGELGVKDPSVVDRMGHVLANGTDDHVKSYVLDAFAKIASPRMLPWLLPLVEGDGMLRERALRVLTRLGSGITRDLEELRKTGGPPQRRAINHVLARVRGAQGTRLLLEALKDEEATVVDDALFAIRQEIKAAPPKERREFRDRIREFLKSRAARDSDRARAAAIRVLGFLDDPGAQTLVLPYLAPTFSTAVRSAALAALRSMPRAKGNNEALVKRLVPLLEDAEASHVVGPAIDVLQDLDLPDSMAGELERLVRSRRPDVKRFVLGRLKDVDTPASATILLRFLEDDDLSIRDLAARSLTRVKSARAVLFDRLLRDTNLDRAWIHARILQPHAPSLGAEQMNRLSERILRLLDQEQRVYEPLLFLLRHASPKEARLALVRRGLRKKRARRFEEAARTFRLLERNEIFDAEVRYELAIALLKLASRDPLIDARDEDPALQLVAGLANDGAFDLFERLRKETVLTADDYFFVGFHFVGRSHTEEQRRLGAELLRLVTRKAAKLPLAKDAREKLAREGLR